MVVGAGPQDGIRADGALLLPERFEIFDAQDVVGVAQELRRIRGMEVSGDRLCAGGGMLGGMLA